MLFSITLTLFPQMWHGMENGCKKHFLKIAKGLKQPRVCVFLVEMHLSDLDWISVPVCKKKIPILRYQRNDSLCYRAEYCSTPLQT